MDEMHEAALEYGIVLKDLAVIDRQFKGEIASTMDKLTSKYPFIFSNTDC